MFNLLYMLSNSDDEIVCSFAIIGNERKGKTIIMYFIVHPLNILLLYVFVCCKRRQSLIGCHAHSAIPDLQLESKMLAREFFY